MRLADKVAIVTGGGGPGIGRAIAERFAREGARVVVADLVAERAAEVTAAIGAAGGTALTVEADVTRAAAVEALATRAIEAFGRVDILVNNAGRSRGDDIRTIDEVTWDWNFAVVLKSAYLCSRALVPGMIARGGGAIVNIASVNGLTGLGEEAYGAAKAGMVNLTQNLAVKYGRHGVRANCICPGTIRTPAWAGRLARDPHVFERLTKWYPLGRVGEPADIANAALFLASDEAAWLTGAILPVDGGLMAGNGQMNRELVGGGE
ncbi:MAG: glucose 1-dehydrogenase [Chloroflexota bacterium]|nr:glucose 1-dehydrogenase [Chloroflexota bacterium]